MTDEKPNGEAMLQRVVDAFAAEHAAERAADDAHRAWEDKAEESRLASLEVADALSELAAAVKAGKVTLEVSA